MTKKILLLPILLLLLIGMVRAEDRLYPLEQATMKKLEGNRFSITVFVQAPKGTKIFSRPSSKIEIEKIVLFIYGTPPLAKNQKKISISYTLEVKVSEKCSEIRLSGAFSNIRLPVKVVRIGPEERGVVYSSRDKLFYTPPGPQWNREERKWTWSKKTLPPGVYYTNPLLTNIIPITLKVQKEKNRKIKIPTRDGFEILLTFSLEWRVNPQKAVAVVKEYRRIFGLARTILAYLEFHCRNLGSKFECRDFVAEGFQKKIEKAIQKKLFQSIGSKGLILKSLTLKKMKIPPEILLPIMAEREARTRMKNRKKKILEDQFKKELQKKFKIPPIPVIQATLRENPPIRLPQSGMFLVIIAGPRGLKMDRTPQKNPHFKHLAHFSYFYKKIDPNHILTHYAYLCQILEKAKKKSFHLVILGKDKTGKALQYRVKILME